MMIISDTQPAINPTTNQIELFDQLLATLWRGGNVGNIWTLDPRTERSRSTWIEVGETLPALPQDQDVYFGVHPLAQIPQTNAKGEPRQPHAVRSQIAHIASVNCFYAEFDEAAAEPAVPPSVVIASSGDSGKTHCYWLLDETIQITDDNRDLMRAYQARFVLAVGSDPDAKDMARVLRVAGTHNHKYDTPKPVHFVQANFAQTYTLDQMIDAFGLAAEPAATSHPNHYTTPGAVATQRNATATAALLGKSSTPQSGGSGGANQIVFDSAIALRSDGVDYDTALIAAQRINAAQSQPVATAELASIVTNAYAYKWTERSYKAHETLDHIDRACLAIEAYALTHTKKSTTQVLFHFTRVARASNTLNITKLSQYGFSAEAIKRSTAQNAIKQLISLGLLIITKETDRVHATEYTLVEPYGQPDAQQISYAREYMRLMHLSHFRVGSGGSRIDPALVLDGCDDMFNKLGDQALRIVAVMHAYGEQNRIIDIADLANISRELCSKTIKALAALGVMSVFGLHDVLEVSKDVDEKPTCAKYTLKSDYESTLKRTDIACTHYGHSILIAYDHERQREMHHANIASSGKSPAWEAAARFAIAARDRSMRYEAEILRLNRMRWEYCYDLNIEHKHISLVVNPPTPKDQPLRVNGRTLSPTPKAHLATNHEMPHETAERNFAKLISKDFLVAGELANLRRYAKQLGIEIESEQVEL